MTLQADEPTVCISSKKLARGTVGGGGRFSRRGEGLGAGACPRAGVKIFGQRVRSEAKFHQGLGFRQARLRETVGVLEAAHGLPRGVIPLPVRLIVQVARLNQSLLNFLDALRLELLPGQAGAIGLFATPPS
jgi:hypothetical protein